MPVGGGPSATPPTPFISFTPPIAPVNGKFYGYQTVLSPLIESNESRNPPSAAFAGQGVGARGTPR